MHFPSAGWVGTCDTKWRHFLSFRHRLTSASFMKRTLVCFAFSWIHGRGNVVLGWGSGPCFQTLTSSSVPPFFPPRREASQREKDTGSERLNADSNFNIPTALHEKKNSFDIPNTHIYSVRDRKPWALLKPQRHTLLCWFIMTPNHFWFPVFSSWWLFTLQPLNAHISFLVFFLASSRWNVWKKYVLD